MSKRLTEALGPRHTFTTVNGRWIKVFIDSKGQRWIPSGEITNPVPAWVPLGPKRC